ncbi:MAG TPA: hypothetical protein VN628_08370 [Vicinamibacterales bacterium]|nr:hypothetical protein [Vicinamibacterales bacterium]
MSAAAEVSLFCPPEFMKVAVRRLLSDEVMANPTVTSAVPDALFRRIQGEFLEMPGLCLTQPQACRLWGLDRETCHTVLSRLVDQKFLMQTRDGAFVQLDRTQRAARYVADEMFARL